MTMPTNKAERAPYNFSSNRVLNKHCAHLSRMAGPFIHLTYQPTGAQLTGGGGLLSLLIAKVDEELRLGPPPGDCGSRGWFSLLTEDFPWWPESCPEELLPDKSIEGGCNRAGAVGILTVIGTVSDTLITTPPTPAGASLLFPEAGALAGRDGRPSMGMGGSGRSSSATSPGAAPWRNLPEAWSLALALSLAWWPNREGGPLLEASSTRLGAKWTPLYWGGGGMALTVSLGRPPSGPAASGGRSPFSRTPVIPCGNPGATMGLLYTFPPLQRTAVGAEEVKVFLQE